MQRECAAMREAAAAAEADAQRRERSTAEAEERAVRREQVSHAPPLISTALRHVTLISSIGVSAAAFLA